MENMVDVMGSIVGATMLGLLLRATTAYKLASNRHPSSPTAYSARKLVPEILLG